MYYGRAPELGHSAGGTGPVIGGAFVSGSSSPPASTPGPKATSPPPSPPPPSEGIVTDRGTGRREALRARRWSVEGTVKVSREVDVGDADVNGNVSIGGPLTAEQFRARGTLDVAGAVVVHGTLAVRGNTHFAATVQASDLQLDGCVRVRGAVTVERTLTSRGVLEAPSVSAGVVSLEGSATVPGELRALQVDAVLPQPSSLGSVQARTVRLHGRVTNLLDKVFFRDSRTLVDRVEADRVELEGVDVRFVRAKEIVLGRESHVTEVEGAIVRRHPSSSVGPEVKSPLPYGLRR